MHCTLLGRQPLNGCEVPSQRLNENDKASCLYTTVCVCSCSHCAGLQVIPSAKKANWPGLLPSRGTLTCSFNSASVKRPMGVMESSKLATLQRQLRASSMSDRERLELVAMFAPFALLTCKQVGARPGLAKWTYLAGMPRSHPEQRLQL